MNTPAVLVFAVLVAATLAITAWASRRSGSRTQFYTAGGSITGVQNGFAFAGDFLSAAGLLGVAGLYVAAGLDGLVYGLGAIIGWPALLYLMADRMRRLGRYTLTDVLAHRFDTRAVRIYSAVGNLIVLAFYMIAQMVGAGVLVAALTGLGFTGSVLLVGGLMLIYVVFGGMVATTWVQIIKAGLLIGTSAVLTVMVLARFDFSLGAMFGEAVARHPAGVAIMAPGALLGGFGGALSLILSLTLGPAGLPHILMRFFTVPDVIEARRSAMTATALIGAFVVMMVVMGYGAIALLAADPAYTTAPGVLRGGSNMAVLHLADALGGTLLLGVVSAVAFATILAVVAGLTLAAAATVSHDLYGQLIRRGRQSEADELRVSRIAALVFGAVCIAASIGFQNENINLLTVFAMSVAASALFPILVLALYWQGLTAAGVVIGGTAGLLAAVAGLVLGPGIWVAVLKHPAAIFPYQYPTIAALPLTVAVAWAVSRATRQKS